MSVLTEDMKAEDTEVRIKAMQKLKIVAAALGPERTRKELLPYLNGASPRASLARVTRARHSVH